MILKSILMDKEAFLYELGYIRKENGKWININIENSTELDLDSAFNLETKGNNKNEQD